MLAAYLHVDRSSLSRKLFRMKRDGILEVEHNPFRASYIPRVFTASLQRARNSRTACFLRDR